MTAGKATMGREVGKRMRERLTNKVSGPQNAGPLERRVRPEGQKGAPSLEDGRGPRKSAGPRKRRSTARMIAGGADWQALDAKKARKPLEQGRALEQVGARMKRVMGLTAKVSRPP